jgi:hypothetical protein
MDNPQNVFKNHLTEALHDLTINLLTTQDNLNHHSYNIIIAIFNIELHGIKLTNTEKERIGPILLSTLPYLETCIDEETLCFPTCSFENACHFRSGVQFLLDSYDNYFPSEDIESTGITLQKFEEHHLDLPSFDAMLINHTAGENDPFIDVTDSKNSMDKLHTKTPHTWWTNIHNTSSKTSSHSFKLGQPVDII